MIQNTKIDDAGTKLHENESLKITLDNKYSVFLLLTVCHKLLVYIYLYFTLRVRQKYL